MSELQNPLFDDEKEFLERKKLEYERALRGDVDHIKEKSVAVGKVALVGAGLAGGIWLITKAFGGKKRKKKKGDPAAATHRSKARRAASAERPDHDQRDQGELRKSAADSAQVFQDYHESRPDPDDPGFGSVAYKNAHAEPDDQPVPFSPGAFADPDFEADPFEDLPYDDSRRLPISHAFDGAPTAPAKARNAGTGESRSRVLGSMLQAFLKTDTGKVLMSQAGAVALGIVTKKVGEFFPAAKNSDLAASPGGPAAADGDSLVASSASPVPSDASNSSQSS